jgi:hypothetical protein
MVDMLIDASCIWAILERLYVILISDTAATRTIDNRSMLSLDNGLQIDRWFSFG